MAERNAIQTGTRQNYFRRIIFQAHNMSQIDYKLLTRAAHARLKLWQAAITETPFPRPAGDQEFVLINVASTQSQYSGFHATLAPFLDRHR
jgi:hypothetical protein